jgi:hypothetical protein
MAMKEAGKEREGAAAVEKQLKFLSDSGNRSI